MAEIPPFAPTTIEFVGKAREAKQRPYHSIGIPVGKLGAECERQLWYGFRWAYPPEVFDARRLRIFESGNIEEARIVAGLKDAKFEVLDLDPATGKQFKIRLVGGHVRGKTDGKIRGIPEAPNKWHVLECKSHNDKSFNDMIKNGLEKSKPEHFVQCQIYMHADKIDRTLYYFVNKNDDTEYSYRVEYDQLLCISLELKAERVITSSHAPAKQFEDPTSKLAFTCGFCKAKELCQEGGAAARNCRTCLHSTAHLDGDARWSCARHNHDLTIEQQQAGCPNHLFLPDLVAGEQVDADEGGEWVEYRMADGSIWRDGGAE